MDALQLLVPLCFTVFASSIISIGTFCDLITDKIVGRKSNLSVAHMAPFSIFVASFILWFSLLTNTYSTEIIIENRPIHEVKFELKNNSITKYYIDLNDSVEYVEKQDNDFIRVKVYKNFRWMGVGFKSKEEIYDKD